MDDKAREKVICEQLNESNQLLYTLAEYPHIEYEKICEKFKNCKEYLSVLVETGLVDHYIDKCRITLLGISWVNHRKQSPSYKKWYEEYDKSWRKEFDDGCKDAAKELFDGIISGEIKVGE